MVHTSIYNEILDWPPDDRLTKARGLAKRLVDEAWTGFDLDPFQLTRGMDLLTALICLEFAQTRSHQPVSLAGLETQTTETLSGDEADDLSWSLERWASEARQRGQPVTDWSILRELARYSEDERNMICRIAVLAIAEEIDGVCRFDGVPIAEFWNRALPIRSVLTVGSS